MKALPKKRRVWILHDPMFLLPWCYTLSEPQWVKGRWIAGGLGWGWFYNETEGVLDRIFPHLENNQVVEVEFGQGIKGPRIPRSLEICETMQRLYGINTNTRWREVCVWEPTVKPKLIYETR